MKKILMICMVVQGVMPAHATTMCAADDTLSIVLDPSIAGTAHNSSAELSEWWAEFPYGTVFGISTCVSTPSGAPTDTLIDADTGDIATGAERLGVYCWCKMIHPVNSRWVFRLTFTTFADCRSGCASNCAYYVRGYTSYRVLMFGSIND